MPINVSIIEDKEKPRESLRILIDGAHGFRCVSAHDSAEEALSEMPFDKTQVVLVDLGLPEMSGVECVRELKMRHPRLLILILTIHEDVEKIFKSLAAGAHGYLLKTTPYAEVLGAIKEVCEGGAPMTPSIARKVIQHFHKGSKDGGDLARLTHRELEILNEIATNRSSREIAARLGIAYDTIRTHLRSIYHKLHVTSRTAAVLKFLEKR